MKIWKRVASFLLATSLALSVPITSLADPVLGEGGMQDNTASSGDTNYGGSGNPPSSSAVALESKFGIWPDSQGIRISIVDKAGNRVTNSIDIVQYNPFSFLDGTSPWQSGWNQYNDYFGTNTYKDLGFNKNNSFFFSNGIKTEEYTPATWSQTEVPPAKVNGYDIETHIYTKGYFETYLKMYYDDRIKQKGIADVGQAPTVQMPVIVAGSNRLAGGRDLMNVFRSPLGQIPSENTKVEENVITVLVNMSIDRCDNTGKPSGAGHLFTFADPSIESLRGQDKSKLLGTSSGGSNNNSGGPGGNSSINGNSSQDASTSDDSKIRASDIIMAKEYKIIVEPLFWDVMSVGLLNGHPYGNLAHGGLPAVCYGTNSYLSKYTYERAREFFKYTNDDIFNYAYLGQNWRESFIGVETLQLAYTDSDLGIKTIQEAGLTPKPHADGHNYYTLADLASGDNYKTIGYSVHIYDRLLQSSDSGTPTWDQITYPKDNYKPGPSPSNIIPGKPNGPEYPPEYPPEGDEYKITNKDHQFHIIKFYAEKQPDGSYKYKENHTRDNTVHTININDEPNYTVDNWYTSSTYTPPTNPTDDYDIWKTTKAPKTTQEGVKSGRVTVKASDPDTTLYIRLVSTPMLTVIKYFPDGSTKIEEIPWQPTYDTSEPGFEYEQDKQDPNPKPDPIPSTFGSAPGTPETNPNITVNTSTRTIYINYVEPIVEAGVITLHQNELAHTFNLSDIADLITVTHTFPSKEKSGSDTHYCGGCRTDSDGDSWCPGHRCSWTRLIDDSDYSYVISNKENYASTTFVGSQGSFEPVEEGTLDDSGSFGMSGGTTAGLTPNLKFSIYRDKVKDNVTLYPNKNNSVKGELAQIFITAEGYTPQTNRVQNEGSTQWYSNFKINYTYDTEDNELSWYTSCSYNGTNHDSGTWNGTESPTLSSVNSAFSQGNNVLTKAYLGQPGTGDKTTTQEKEPFTIFGKLFNRNLKFSPNESDSAKFANDGKFFEFYPYTEMEYQTVQDLSNKLAYITSTNLSKVRNNTSMEVGVHQSGSGFGIGLSSEQWSTHQRTLTGLGNYGIDAAMRNKSLIPGGAVVKLSTGNNNISGEDVADVWVGFRSYEMSVPDDLKVTLSATDGVKTTSEAKASANQFFEDMKNNLSNYHVEKWIKEGITKEQNDLNNSTKVSGINNIDGAPATSFGGNTLSTDKKYYLKKDATDPTSSKFDVINSNFEQHVYRVSSDVHGKVTVTKDGSAIVSADIKSSRDISTLLANEDVKRIDARVKFVTNFVQSLDFEGGKDRESMPWYFEAHDGIEVVESIGAVQVGFGGENPIRSEVVDPKLTGELLNRDDTINFDSTTIDKKARTVQYRMSASPTTKPGVAGYIGTFNGMDITVPSMNSIMRTRLHYMNNNTVMDLN